MNRKYLQLFTWLIWLTLPLTALRYWLVWDRLPLRMATHFAANGQPNGWMSRQVSFHFALGITAFMLAVFTVVSLAAQKAGAPPSVSWAALSLSYVIQAILYWANSSVLGYNLNGDPLVLGPVIALLPLAVFALIAVYLSTKRGDPLPDGAWYATETHGAPLWALLFMAPVVLELWMFSATPQVGLRLAGVLMSLLFFFLAVFAWTGFQYRFGAAGVEIRTMGFRLRSIPAAQIQSYAPEHWNILRGYGIRGVGRSRAYVWGNQVVHIATTDGDVFLGHDDPHRIIRDLDAIAHKARGSHG